MFVDPKNSQSEAREWISAASVQTMRLTDLPDASRVAANTQSVGLIIVDLDGCGGIAVAASDLITFRLEHHEIPLILISSESACDEFGSERLAIADVTLRFPLSISRFDLALAKVEMNNLEWQHRVKCQLTTSLLKDVLEAGQRRKIY
ncbi:MAG: hypothetical protein Q7J44_18920 [Pseudotabrizicola sp.]|uniref:hypothetical protein n=1 Tax=Pseudotabrizicola sp. TaxID=2939647 RepID=UPI002724A830|nr:hypothetical protein [Pseudotabrizicola sp.]MDO9640614.1 hypothetical protein [Pseudotabrizicola sp.]